MTDIEAIRKWAGHEPTWDEQNDRTSFQDPVCYIKGCGQPTVTYVDPALNASATRGPTKFYPVCATHGGKPLDLEERGKRYARELFLALNQKDRVIGALKAMLAESDPCIHVQIQEAMASIERGEGITLEELNARLADRLGPPT